MKILFQGDSITDWDRSRTDDSNIGRGYVQLAASRLSLDYPQKFEFINRGISGNTVADIYARKGADIISIRPDFMSIMVGTNDQPWVDNPKIGERYEKVYDMLIGEVLEDLPDLKIMILEPFLLPGDRVVAEGYELRRANTEKRAEVSRMIAEKYGARFLPLQHLLDEACEKAPVSYWTIEGVHLTNAANQILADAWVKEFKDIFKI